MGIFEFFKQSSDSASPVKDNSNRELLFEKEFLIVGTEYPCRKKPKKTRQEVVSKTSLKSLVRIEPYIYNHEQAYMIVNAQLNLDLGVLSQGAASWLKNYYSKGVTQAVLTQKKPHSFIVKISVYK